jgi:serine/threonine-protein kinase
MAEAHSHGFVHRDLKPPNLFLTRGPDGRPLIKILDFGIAKASIDGIDTSTKAVMGSPTYMSPEQWEGARYVDERGDIWALGAILQFLLSGRPPFHGDSLPVLFRNIASREPRSLAQPELAVPPGLQAVVRRCLAKSAHDRPQTAAELATLLAPYGPIESEEYAQKAQRVARAGTEGTVLGQGAFPTPIQDLHANGLVNIADEPPPQDPTSVTTLSNAGTLPGVNTMAEQVSARNWLPYIGVALVLVGAVTFGAIADEPEDTGNSSASEATVPDEIAPKPDSPKIEESPPTPKPTELPPAPDTPPAAMTKLTLSTTPAGARIWINGEEKGTSPLKIRLAIGSTVWARFDLEGYDSLEQEIEVTGDMPQKGFYLVSIAGGSAAETGESTSDNRSNDSTKSRRSRKKGTSGKGGVIKSGKSRREKIRDSADRRH